MKNHRQKRIEATERKIEYRRRIMRKTWRMRNYITIDPQTKEKILIHNSLCLNPLYRDRNRVKKYNLKCTCLACKKPRYRRKKNVESVQEFEM